MANQRQHNSEKLSLASPKVVAPFASRARASTHCALASFNSFYRRVTILVALSIGPPC